MTKQSLKTKDQAIGIRLVGGRAFPHDYDWLCLCGHWSRAFEESCYICQVEEERKLYDTTYAVEAEKEVITLRKKLTWPEFYHWSGNKFPLKELKDHLTRHKRPPVITDENDHESSIIPAIPRHLCHYCGLADRGEGLEFSDQGVTLTEREVEEEAI